ncbi:MAG TPA: PQQ-binding-like beta-propeller repeat protein [Gemmataceae bacterium]|nr:PQQ-binding-like beta-propeller repeat protein [Gemmataceae bacterium]
MAGRSGLCRCTFSIAVLAVVAGCGRPAVTVPASVPVAVTATARAPTKSHGPWSDWPRFLGPFGTGVSPETGIRTDWTGDLPVVWQKEVGEGYSAPAIADDRLFHFDRHGNQARLTAYDADSAVELWRFEYTTDYVDKYGYDGGPRACPVVDGDRVYIYGPEGMLHCVGAADGKPRWKVDTQSTYKVVQNFFGVSGVPVIEGDLLIVPVGGSPNGQEPDDFRDLKGNGTGIVAFDKFTGRERYRTTDELASYTSPMVAGINGRRLGLYWSRHQLVAFQPATGQIEFQFAWRSRQLESVNAANPLVVGDRILLTECYGLGSVLLKVPTAGPQVVWKDDPNSRRKRLECHWNTPIHVDGFIYGSSGRSETAELRCIELATGEVKWREPDLGRASLMFVDGHFIVFTEFGSLLLVKPDPTRYVEIARFDLGRTGRRLLGAYCWAAPVLSHGRLYLRSKGTLLALELIPRG